LCVGVKIPANDAEAAQAAAPASTAGLDVEVEQLLSTLPAPAELQQTGIKLTEMQFEKVANQLSIRVMYDSLLATYILLNNAFVVCVCVSFSLLFAHVL
jgi:hypothetical protein